MRTVRLRVDLRDVTPSCVRVLDLPRDATLDEAHLVLQAALGWTHTHLHLYEVGETTYGPADEDDIVDERSVRVRDLPGRWTYLYDLGDGWTHDVVALGPGGDEPGLVYAEGACPPEDCGGPQGFAQLDERPELDPEATATLVRHVCGRVPPSVRMLLDVVGERMTLTVAGRLPRATVRDVQERRPEWAVVDRPAHREEDLPALVGLHQVLHARRVVQLQRGVMVPVKAAGDPVALLRRVREHFDPQDFLGLLATSTVAFLVACGPGEREQIAERFLATFGRGWRVDGHGLTADDVDLALIGIRHELEGLDQVQVHGSTWSAGPEARWLLPHAVLMADLVERGLLA